MGYRKTLGMNDKMPFGKYKGIRVNSIITDNYQYIEWLLNNTATNFTQEVLNECKQYGYVKKRMRPQGVEAAIPVEIGDREIITVRHMIEELLKIPDDSMEIFVEIGEDRVPFSIIDDKKYNECIIAAEL